MIVRVASCAFLFVPALALAHSVADTPKQAWAWSAPSWLLLPGAVALLLYGIGLARLWHRAGIGRGVSGAELAAFVTGVLILFLALVWPLDGLGEWSLAAHMGQHMLLLALVPPLLLLGHPRAILAQALPDTWSQRIHRLGHRGQQRATTLLALATLVHCAVMVVWHLPAATAAALTSEALHWTMHASFLIAGLWFWSAMLHRVREPHAGVGPALVAIIAVMMTMGLLGALLVFARRPLYPIYAERTPQLGLDVLADQQLAGLIMWVPSALPYVLGGIALAALGLRWLQRHDAGASTPATHAGAPHSESEHPGTSGSLAQANRS